MSRVNYGAGQALIAAALQSATDECILWPFATTDRGYPHGSVAGRSRRIHKWVCEQAHGPQPSGKEAAHSCHVRACINPRHLRWATHGENLMDRVENGTSNRGERHPLAKLTASDVRNIRRMRTDGCLYREIAEAFGISPYHVGNILRGTTWGWLQ